MKYYELPCQYGETSYFIKRKTRLKFETQKWKDIYFYLSS